MFDHSNFTLQQRATLSVGTSIWTHKAVKAKITKWSENQQMLELEKVKDEWRQLTNEVVEELNQNILPPELTVELRYFVKKLGKKILNWYVHIWYEYYYLYENQGDIINYIDPIYWTSIGTIDEAKIIQSSWLKNPELDIAIVYKMACHNALEEDIDDLWKTRPSDMKNCYDKFSIYLRYDDPFDGLLCSHRFLHYWKYQANDELDHFKNIILSDQLFSYESSTVFNQNYSVELNMFFVSIFECYSTAVKYLWKKLTQDERDISIMQSAYLVANNNRDLECYKGEKYFEILIFLINQMTMTQKESFLTMPMSYMEEFDFSVFAIYQRKRIIDMFLLIWPWQEFFVSLLSDMFQYLEYNNRIILEILYYISYNMFYPSDDAENHKYRSMFHEVWFIIPRLFKKVLVDVDIDSPGFRNFMVNLLEEGDFDSIKMIFNDPEITDVRIKYIAFGRLGYLSLIESKKYELLHQFADEVLQSEQEKIYFHSITGFSE